jgi:hypothetical protein
VVYLLVGILALLAAVLVESKVSRLGKE